MNDLELWQRLTSIDGDDDLAEVVTLMHALSELGMRERGPFMGFVDRLLAHEHAPLRAATVSLLAGTHGHEGLDRIVTALDDDDARVRAEAVRTLRKCAGHTPTQWAHAMFHPRVDVRRLALETESPPGLDMLGAYLRADPELSAQAAERRWPAKPCALIFDMLLRGHIDEATAAEGLAAAPPDDLRTLLKHSVRRAPEVVGTSLGLVETGKPASAPGRDLLDLWCRVYWAAEAFRPDLQQRLADAVFGKYAPLRGRTALALLAYGESEGHDDDALQLAAACHPALLCGHHLPLAQRRVAAIGLRRYRQQMSKVQPHLLTRLLEVEGLAGTGRDLDLGLAALLASFYNGRCIQPLVRIFGEDALRDAAASQPEAWSTLAELPDDADGGPTWFLALLLAKHPAAAAEFAAVGLPLWQSASANAKNQKKDAPPTVFDRVLDQLDGPASAEVLTLLARPGIDAPSLKQLVKLADALEPKIKAKHAAEVFVRLLPTAYREPEQLVLQRLLHRASNKDVVLMLAGLDTSSLEAFCRHVDSLAIPLDKELSLANALKGHHDETVAAWARGVLTRGKGTSTVPRKQPANMVKLTRRQVQAIHDASDAGLPRALKPALEAPCTGLAAALASRAAPSYPVPMACVALIGCGDRPEQVSAQLDRFGPADQEFVAVLGPLVVSTWQGNGSVSALAHAWLHRWEKHGFALLAWLDGLRGGLAEGLRSAANLNEPLARRVFWEGITGAVLLRRYRQAARLRGWATAEVMTLLVEQLDTELGPHAARMLSTFHVTGFAGEHLERLRDRVVMLAPDMDANTRRELERWVRIDGLEARATPARPHVARLSTDRLASIRTLTDVLKLAKFVASANAAVVHEAALRLVELGPDGQQTLASLLDPAASDVSMLAITTSISLWEDDVALEMTRALARDDRKPTQLRFRIATALHERGEDGWGIVALASAAQPCPSAWLSASDWDLLCRIVPNMRTLSTALAGSVHPHAYQRSVKWLLDHAGNDAQSLAALEVFLRAGTHRPAYLRRAAARRLLERGNSRGLVVCLAQVMDPDERSYRWLYDRAGGREGRDQLLQHVLDATLLGGKEACTEERAVTLLSSKVIASSTRDDVLRRLLMHGLDPKVREKLVNMLSTGALRDVKLSQVSDIFAWGVRKGRELTGRLFRVHMTERRADLGYTRMNENTIYVSPLPMLRRDRQGRDVVEALILHEYGHHLYHRDKKSQRVWNRAVKEGIGSLLNLVADEHLERRLRAMNAEYGDRLKRLAAYAFQHTNREIELVKLLSMLQSSAFEALSARSLGVAFDEKSVVVDSGLVLRELDRRGHPFARFVRAMRMGLGDRHDDSLLREALALFKGGFRHHDMQRLYEIAKKLSEMYGTHSDLADAYGGHESLEWGEREGQIHSDGVSDDEVQQEVERILNPRKPSGNAPEGKLGGKLQINVGSNDAFDLITRVERVPPEREQYRQIATEVRRHAFRLRTYFEEIGLSLVPRRARLRGRAFDRTRVRAVVTRRDPRMLVARELEIHTDLFIAVVVDCSGSMAAGRSMEKAHRFGVLLAEAARGLAGVDARFFGFTDRVIFDAGDERNCGVTRLQPTGGNNDAAGLHYAASVAAASRRKAKLVVMISDGLPTECSVDALRNLVTQLTRRKGILCAQVAVRPLTEVCFPHYIELLDEELDRAVRRFGEIISGLARRALGR
ncbi:MAG: vWA domain-containing protein [Myxococcota bacterium]